MQQIAHNVTRIGALKRGFVAVEHVLEHGEKGLERDADLHQGVRDPGFQANAVLVLKCVAFEHREEVSNGEHGV